MQGIIHSAIPCYLEIKVGAHTFPYLEVDNSTAIVEHEATTSKIGGGSDFLLQPERYFN